MPVDTSASSGGFPGVGTDRYPLPWNMLKYDTDKDGYVVNIDKAPLESAARCWNSSATTRGRGVTSTPTAS